LEELIAFHHEHGKIATVTAVQPAGRFGLLTWMTMTMCQALRKKWLAMAAGLMAVFFVLRPEVFSYLPPDADFKMWSRIRWKTFLEKSNLWLTNTMVSGNVWMPS